MSMHYSSGNQFNDEYDPRKLGNWQVSHWYPDAPLPRKSKTIVVSNENGHLLPGVPRSKDNPWGNYKGTWHLPKKINRETANLLSAPNQIHVNSYKKRVERYKKQQQDLPPVKTHHAIDTKIQLDKDIVKSDCQCCGPCTCPNKLARPAIEELNETTTDEKDEQYKDYVEDKITKKTRPPCPIHDL